MINILYKVTKQSLLKQCKRPRGPVRHYEPQSNKTTSNKTTGNKTTGNKTTSNKAKYGKLGVLGLISICLPSMSLPNAAWAQDIQPDFNAQTKLSQQQQAWQDDLIEQRIKALVRTQPQSPLTEPPTSTEPNPTEPNPTEATPPPAEMPLSQCINLQHIYLSQLPHLGQAQAAALTREANQIADDGCITVNEANLLARQITEAYLQAGYFKITIWPTLRPINTPVANAVAEGQRSLDGSKLNTNLSPQHVAYWQVNVAKITQIDNRTDLPTKRLFGDVLGQVANMAWLDQAVSNAERVLNGRLLIDIYPAADDEHNVRLIVTQQGDIDAYTGELAWQHDPDDSYGRQVLTGKIKLHNVLGQADVTSISVEQTLDDSYGYDKDNHRYSASIYTSIPNGRWQWSGLLANSGSERTTQLPNAELQQSSASWQINARGDYTVSRNQDSITSVYGQLAHQDVQTEILGSQLDVQSPRLSSVRLGINKTKLFNNLSDTKAATGAVRTGVWVIDASVEKGLGWNDNPASRAGLKDDYWRLLLSGYLSQQQSLGKMGNSNLGSLQLSHQLLGQYSKDRQYGVSQYAIDNSYGGVRGLSNASRSATSGVSLQNTLSYVPHINDWVSVGRHKIRWSPYVGVDAGMLKNTGASMAESASEHAYSGTLGLSLMGYDGHTNSMTKRWQLDTYVSRARTNYEADEGAQTQEAELTTSLRWFY